MHDIRFIRENPEAFDAGLARRGLDPLAKALAKLGADVRLVSGPVSVADPAGVTTVAANSPYYGGTIGLNHLMEAMGQTGSVDINPFLAGVITLGFIYGAYMTETFRGAILSIPKGQVEAAWAFGMGRVQTFWRITLPMLTPFLA